jgi:predicted AAA+ superfamily ATPase
MAERAAGLRGGFPRAFLADDDDASLEWRQDFIQSSRSGISVSSAVRIPAETLRRFWTMLAHYHAQIWNGAEIHAGADVFPLSTHIHAVPLTAIETEIELL